MRVRTLLGLGLVPLIFAACGDGGGSSDEPDAGGPDAATAPDARDWPAGEPPASTVPEAGVRRDVLRVPGATAPPNPVTGDTTPAAENVIQVLRYRADVEPAAAPHAILVAMPGFLAGGASYDGLARALVLRSVAAEAPIEVWAIDRRANVLEDLRGLDAAEVAGDPEIATHYYFDGDTVGGQAFGAFQRDAELGRVSEWGLATTVGDVHALIARVPAAERQARVFLMGHSLGASFAELYAAWRFEDGTRGAEELAGVILVDGLLQPAPIEETAWHEGSTFGGILAIPGVDAQRATGGRVVALPLLGVDLHVVGEIMALRALVAPDAVVEDAKRDRTAGFVIGLGPDDVPAWTNAGALGLAFDDRSCGLQFAAVSMGVATGGPMVTYENALAGMELEHPGDPTATYDWIDARDADPKELVPLARFAHAISHGRANLTEWYFPARLVSDILALGGGDIAEDSWQAGTGLRAFDGDLIDAPFLTIGTAQIRGTNFEILRTRLAAVGAGRPQAGASRDQAEGLEILDLPGQTHVDPLLGLDLPENPVPGAVEAFMTRNATAGTIASPTLTP